MKDYIIGKVDIPQGMLIHKDEYKTKYGWNPEADITTGTPSDVSDEEESTVAAKQHLL